MTLFELAQLYATYVAYQKQGIARFGDFASHVVEGKIHPEMWLYLNREEDDETAFNFIVKHICGIDPQEKDEV